MNDYIHIIDLLEKIKTNELDSNTDYEIVEILNDTINKIQEVNTN